MARKQQLNGGKNTEKISPSLWNHTYTRIAGSILLIISIGTVGYQVGKFIEGNECKHDKAALTQSFNEKILEERKKCEDMKFEQINEKTAKIEALILNLSQKK